MPCSRSQAGICSTAPWMRVGSFFVGNIGLLYLQTPARYTKSTRIDRKPRSQQILRVTPEKFYKGGGQEKTRLRRPEFFLLPSPGARARLVLTCRAIA